MADDDTYNVPGNWNDSSPMMSGITPASARQQVGREIQSLGDDEKAITDVMAAKGSALKGVLTRATDQLRNTPVGPSPQEQWDSMMGAWLSAPTFTQGVGRMSTASAQSMAAQSEAELAKQELMLKYGLEQAQYGALPTSSNDASSGSDVTSGTASQSNLMGGPSPDARSAQ